jgi:hypothetical protein
MSDNDDADSHGHDYDTITSSSETGGSSSGKEDLGLVLCFSAGSFNS